MITYPINGVIVFRYDAQNSSIGTCKEVTDAQGGVHYTDFSTEHKEKGLQVFLPSFIRQLKKKDGSLFLEHGALYCTSGYFCRAQNTQNGKPMRFVVFNPSYQIEKLQAVDSYELNEYQE